MVSQARKHKRAACCAINSCRSTSFRSWLFAWLFARFFFPSSDCFHFARLFAMLSLPASDCAHIAFLFLRGRIRLIVSLTLSCFTGDLLVCHEFCRQVVGISQTLHGICTFTRLGFDEVP